MVQEIKLKTAIYNRYQEATAMQWYGAGKEWGYSDPG